MVEKEMASTSEAIEDAVRRIEVSQSCRMGHGVAECPSLLYLSHLTMASNPSSCFPTGDDEPGQE